MESGITVTFERGKAGEMDDVSIGRTEGQLRFMNDSPLHRT
jgi:hypothetical protein